MAKQHFRRDCWVNSPTQHIWLMMTFILALIARVYSSYQNLTVTISMRLVQSIWSFFTISSTSSLRITLMTIYFWMASCCSRILVCWLFLTRNSSSFWAKMSAWGEEIHENTNLKVPKKIEEAILKSACGLSFYDTRNS